ncbi:hypothetical protein Taro_014519 [Colocasia esculenta]|uniref:SecA family profile domain-containing protein n=1 Tax=Colocasia esculenta TaxID=4460 RepID=A0A843UJ27_COLES|nr:hypothetical protein [Colocasia esculenta]
MTSLKVVCPGCEMWDHYAREFRTRYKTMMFLMNALKAKEFYRRDVQYIVRNGKALIVNECSGPVSDQPRPKPTRVVRNLHVLDDTNIRNGAWGGLLVDGDDWARHGGWGASILQLTGRVEEKRRWSEGIHQAVEAKEGLKIQEKEFLKMFRMPVVEVPTNLPNIRQDLPIQAFATAHGKWEHVRKEVEYMFRSGRPVLVGTTSVENSEYLSDLLKRQNIPHNVLNARPKYAAREAEIIAQAGREYAITISTNMAGRGTDIILGGNPKMLAKEIIEERLLPFLTKEAPNVETDGEQISQKALSKITIGAFSSGMLGKAALMGTEVKRLGGLHVIGTSLHESRRIDNQDEMFQKFNFDTEWAVKLISKITNNEDTPIEGDTIVKQLLALQKNAEKYFFNIRKSLVEFDEVLELDEVIVGVNCIRGLRERACEIRRRRKKLKENMICRYMQAVVDEIIFKNVDPRQHPSRWKLGELLDEYIGISGRRVADLFAEVTIEDFYSSLEQISGLQSITVDTFSIPDLPMPPAFRGIQRKNSSLKRWLIISNDDALRKGRYGGTANLLRKYLGDFLIATYLEDVQDSGYDDAYVQEIERAVIVKTLDSFWRDHLVNMNRLSSAVNVRSFGHRNPLEEYKIDGCKFFISMLSATRRLIVESLLQYWSSPTRIEELE